LPAKDRYHDVVVRALQNAGWQITAEQIALILEGRRLWVDLRALNPDQITAILIEIKGFENTPSPVDYLESAIGKYVLYRVITEYLEIDLSLYLAVPLQVYEGFLQEEIAQQVIQRLGIKVVVFDPDREELVKWIH
jgi:hypothetical protein